jgi:hypothetical protein
MRAIRWVTPRPGDGRYAIVWVNIAKLDAAWRNDDPLGQFYIPAGRGYVASMTEPIKMPIIGVGVSVGFENGRHRFAWARDHGAESLPVCV